MEYLNDVFAAMGVFWIVWLPIVAILLASMWKIFVKANKPGWAAIVPIYNIIIFLEIIGRPMWWILFYLASFIPFVGFIVLIAITIITTLDLAKSFGKSTGFAVLLILLPVVGYPILAFGEDKYLGPAAKATEAPKESQESTES